MCTNIPFSLLQVSIPEQAPSTASCEESVQAPVAKPVLPTFLAKGVETMVGSVEKTRLYVEAVACTKDSATFNSETDAAINAGSDHKRAWTPDPWPTSTGDIEANFTAMPATSCRPGSVERPASSTGLVAKSTQGSREAETKEANDAPDLCCRRHRYHSDAHEGEGVCALNRSRRQRQSSPVSGDCRLGLAQTGHSGGTDEAIGLSKVQSGCYGQLSGERDELSLHKRERLREESTPSASVAGRQARVQEVDATRQRHATGGECAKRGEDWRSPSEAWKVKPKDRQRLETWRWDADAELLPGQSEGETAVCGLRRDWQIRADDKSLPSLDWQRQRRKQPQDWSGLQGRFEAANQKGAVGEEATQRFDVLAFEGQHRSWRDELDGSLGSQLSTSEVRDVNRSVSEVSDKLDGFNASCRLERLDPVAGASEWPQRGRLGQPVCLFDSSRLARPAIITSPQPGGRDVARPEVSLGLATSGRSRPAPPQPEPSWSGKPTERCSPIDELAEYRWSDTNRQALGAADEVAAAPAPAPEAKKIYRPQARQLSDLTAHQIDCEAVGWAQSPRSSELETGEASGRRLSELASSRPPVGGGPTRRVDLPRRLRRAQDALIRSASAIFQPAHAFLALLDDSGQTEPEPEEWGSLFSLASPPSGHRHDEAACLRAGAGAGAGGRLAEIRQLERRLQRVRQLE
ncbi:unnamed protein product, partial [Protopolystoma xenopodis]